MTLGAASLWGLVYQRVRGLTLLFSSSSRIRRNHSPALMTVQPSFSTIRCKTLNILIKVCYSLPCLLELSPEPCSPVYQVYPELRGEPRWATRFFPLPH